MSTGTSRAAPKSHGAPNLRGRGRPPPPAHRRFGGAVEPRPGGDRASPRRLGVGLSTGLGRRLEWGRDPSHDLQLLLRGGGGMAKVFLAIDQRLDREVAVKLINPDLRQEQEFDERFQREAKIVSQLSDPHIVVVHDYGLDPIHGPYLVMEYLRGQSLREYLKSEGKLPLRAGIQLGAQILLSLIHAHDKCIIHRDIKPDNVFLLNQSGVRLHARVLDFGISRIVRGDDDRLGENQRLTKPGSILGTPRYMAPEQLAGDSVDARSDLYSAALVIYESLTGKLASLTGKSVCQFCPEAPQELGELLEECLKSDASERPSSAVEVYLRLQELGKASGVLLLPPGAIEKLIAQKKDSGENDPTQVYISPPKSVSQFWLGILLVIAIVVVSSFALWSLFTS